MIDMQYTEEEIREEEEEEKIQTAEVYTGEIGPNDNYPEAIIININENKPMCSNEGRGVAFCIIFATFAVFLFFIFYISIPQQSN